MNIRPNILREVLFMSDRFGLYVTAFSLATLAAVSNFVPNKTLVSQTSSVETVRKVRGIDDCKSDGYMMVKGTPLRHMTCRSPKI
jgi:hypothetical protein